MDVDIGSARALRVESESESESAIAIVSNQSEGSALGSEKALEVEDDTDFEIDDDEASDYDESVEYVVLLAPPPHVGLMLETSMGLAGALQWPSLLLSIFLRYLGPHHLQGWKHIRFLFSDENIILKLR